MVKWVQGVHLYVGYQILYWLLTYILKLWFEVFYTFLGKKQVGIYMRSVFKFNKIQFFVRYFKGRFWPGLIRRC